MNTPPTKTSRDCTTCGAALPDDAPAGLCPQCLLGTALQPGTQVQYFGNYELLGEIAFGGMGIVYRARQISLNRKVALKMIRGGILASSEDVRRFRAEAEAAANLQHPNIVAIHEVGEHDGEQYYSMDLVEGENLAELCATEPLPPERAARYVRAIADAVHFAHQRGTLHRDLKPQNIMIDEHDQPRVLDFGLARQIGGESSLTQSGAVLGSPSYMPPEQAQGRNDRVGVASDVYSIGAILYHLLTSRAPFSGATPAETMRQVIEDEPVAPTEIRPGVPRDLETICLKCLEKNPVQRYASARDLAEDLGRFLNHEPIIARPAGAARRALNWARMHPLAAAAYAAGLVLVLLGGTFAIWIGIEERVIGGGDWQRRIRPMQIGSFAFFLPLIVCYNLCLKHARGVSWRDFFDPSKNPTAVRQPFSRGLLIACVVIGTLSLAFHTIIFLRLVEAVVKLGGSALPPALTLIVSGLFPGFFFGFGLLVGAIREHYANLYGLPRYGEAVSVSAEQRAAIESALLGGRRIEASRIYRQATGSSQQEAVFATSQMLGRLQQERPADFKIDPGANTRLDSQWLALVLVTCCIILAGFTIVGQGAAATSLSIALGMVSGLLIGGASRVRGFWRRMLLTCPAIMLVAILQLAAPKLGLTLSYSLPLWVCGMVAGLLIFGKSAARGEARYA